MSTMDAKSKGITWVGNLYQKFEAMCLEVEDIVCQETTKYVEDQMQSVGVSVKKFYAELMEDFLPPSSEDLEKPKEGTDKNPIEESPLVKELEKGAPDGNILTRGSSFGVFPDMSLLAPSSEDTEKSREGIDTNPIEESPLVNDLEITAPDGKNLSHGSSFSVFPNISHLSPSTEDPIKGTGADLTIEQNEDIPVLYGNLKFGIEEFTVEDKLSSPGYLEVIAPSRNDFSGASLLTGLHNENIDRTCDSTARITTLTSVDVAQCNSTRGVGKIFNDVLDATESISDVSSASSVSLDLPASCFKNEAGIGLTPSVSIPLIELNDDSKVYKTTSSMCDNGKKHCNDCAELDAILPPLDNGISDGYDVEVMAEGNGAARSDEETVNACHHVKLEESCVLVDIDELHLVSQRTVKNKSYKKKLRDALASRMRSGKKQEYERLALLCGDFDMGAKNQRAEISTPARGLDSNKLPIHDFCDSEWEIL